MISWPPLPLLAQAGHRLVQEGWEFLDQHGGNARAERVEQDRVGRMLQPYGSLGEWLARPCAGRLWVSPSLARRWARAACSPADLEWAEDVVGGRYSLLGVERALVGTPPNWHRDLYSGRDWPREPASRVTIQRGDGSDIRTVWELSRCYHFVPLAKAYWRTGDRKFLETFRNHIESWLEQNPLGLGANWRSPMDAAIRAANWTLAVSLFAQADQLPLAFWTRLLTNLRLTARFITRHLEWHPRYRGNHYVSNGIGLVYVGALFPDEPRGAGWLRRGAAILGREMQYQVGPDGVTGEAAIGYHRLMTEFFTYGGEICNRNIPGLLPAGYWDRLRAMYRFIACYLDAQGRAPLLGDADDGRLHLLCARAAAQPLDHRLGLRPRYFPPPLSRSSSPESGSAAFPQGGFYVLRSPLGRCFVRCGPVGLHGAGSHDHNDQLSYELSLEGIVLISDSGTFAYTRSLPERFAFRSTAAHNAIQLGEAEQNPIRPDRPWKILADRTRARCTEWTVDDARVRFSGSHSGYAGRPSQAVCFRRIEVQHKAERWTIVDRIQGRGREAVAWRTHLAPGTVRIRELGPAAWTIEHSCLPSYAMILEVGGLLRLEVKESRLSETYGRWTPRPMLELQGRVELPLEVTLTVRRLEAR